MHRSRLTAALVDVPPSMFEAETRFWSEALGRPAQTIDQNPEYADLGEATPGWQFMVQSVGADPRVHIDIETDDVEAEVQRLEALGATRVEQVKSWWVMRDPAGVLFCVVRVQLPDAFEAHARTWDELPRRMGGPDGRQRESEEEHLANPPPTAGGLGTGQGPEPG